MIKLIILASLIIAITCQFADSWELPLQYDQGLHKNVIQANNIRNFKIKILPEAEFDVDIDLGKMKPFNFAIKETDQNYSRYLDTKDTPICLFEPPHLTFLLQNNVSYEDGEIDKLIDLDQDNEIIYLLTNTFTIKLAALTDPMSQAISMIYPPEFYDIHMPKVSLENVTSGDICVVQERGLIYVTNKFMYYISVNRTSISELYGAHINQKTNPALYSYKFDEVKSFKPRDKVYKAVAYERFVFVACGIDGIDVYEILSIGSQYYFIENLNATNFGLESINITDVVVGGLNYDSINDTYFEESYKDQQASLVDTTIMEDAPGNQKFYDEIITKSSNGSLLVAADSINGVLLMDVSSLKHKTSNTTKVYPFHIPIKNVQKVAKVNEIIFAGGEDDDPETTSTYILHEIFLIGVNLFNVSKEDIKKHYPQDSLYRFNRNLTFFSELLSIYLDDKYVYLNAVGYQEIYLYGVNSTFEPRISEISRYSVSEGSLGMAKFYKNYKTQYLLSISKQSVYLYEEIEEPIIMKCTTYSDLHKNLRMDVPNYYKGNIYTTDCPRKVNASLFAADQFENICQYSYTYEVVMKESLVEKLAGDSPANGLFVGVIIAGSFGGLIIIAVCLVLRYYKQKYKELEQKYQSMDTSSSNIKPSSMGKVPYKTTDAPADKLEVELPSQK